MSPFTAWYTVASAKVVYVPIGTKVNKKGETKTIFARTGVRVDMVDGSWWFYHFKFLTWSRHYKGTATAGRGFNACTVIVELKDSYTPSKLQREYATRPNLLKALEDGTELAYLEEAEKKLAA